MRSIQEQIADWKARRKAVILVHNYQMGEVQDIADFGGDSLGLSQQAAKTDAEMIVFCGVHFMAETAAILSPTKTVIIPDASAGCPMADMITADQLRALKSRHPGAMVVCYVNSTAEVKSESDYCCTSANAVEVVRRLPKDREVIFVPDQYLGRFVAEQVGRKLILFQGFCPTHMRINAADIAAARAAHPGAIVLTHPEATVEVCNAADEVLSTGGMCRFVKASSAKEFLIGTEVGMVHRLATDNPDKKFYPVKDTLVCPNMKKITLERVLWALQEVKEVVTVDPAIAAKARTAIERMIAVTV